MVLRDKQVLREPHDHERGLTVAWVDSWWKDEFCLWFLLSISHVRTCPWPCYSTAQSPSPDACAMALGLPSLQNCAPNKSLFFVNYPVSVFCYGSAKWTQTPGFPLAAFTPPLWASHPRTFTWHGGIWQIFKMCFKLMYLPSYLCLWMTPGRHSGKPRQTRLRDSGAWQPITGAVNQAFSCPEPKGHK